MKKVMGVYQIKNIMNDRRYIGQSIDMYRRWKEHARELENGTHVNTRLLRDYQNYGPNAFSFSVLQIVHDVFDLDDIEKYWIEQSSICCETYNVEYNERYWTNKYEICHD